MGDREAIAPGSDAEGHVDVEQARDVILGGHAFDRRPTTLARRPRDDPATFCVFLERSILAKPQRRVADDRRAAARPTREGEEQRPGVVLVETGAAGQHVKDYHGTALEA